METVSEEVVNAKKNEINDLLHSINNYGLKIEDVSYNIKNSWSNKHGIEVANNIKACVNDMETELYDIKKLLDKLNGCTVGYNKIHQDITTNIVEKH